MKKMNWILGAVLSVVGLLILIFPAACVKMIAVLLGLTAVAYGIYTLVESKKLFENFSFFKTATFIKSICSIVIGILTVILPLTIATTAWKIIVYVFAIFLILAAAFGFYSASVLKEKIVDRKRANLENFSLLLGGVLLILISPEKLGHVIISIVGILILLIGIVFLVMQVIPLVKKRKSSIEVDAVVVDEPAEQESSDSN